MKKIVDNFTPSGGKHCVTTALKQVFDFNNLKLSEDMLFGLASGLSFVYVNLANSPMISGRSKVFEFESKLAERLNISIKCRSSANYSNAFAKSKKLVNSNKPVVIYVDMPYLKYLNLDEESHFGGHAVVLFGYDDESEVCYISDRDNSNYPIRTPKGDIACDYHLVSYNEIEKARSSTHRPFPAKNKYLDIDFSNYQGVTKQALVLAIKETCDNMLNAPAKLLGLNGINKFKNEVKKWSKYSQEKLELACITNYFLINADGGTGGGMFRDMYGNFLIEAAEILNISKMKTLGYSYKEVAKKWDKIADIMWNIYETGNKDQLKNISSIAGEIYEEEAKILSELSTLVINN